MKIGEIWVRYPIKYEYYTSVIVIKSKSIESDDCWVVDAYTENGSKVIPFSLSRHAIKEQYWKFYIGAENEGW